MKQFRLPWRKKPKPTSTGRTFPDVMWTSMCALKESADVFPPLKSAVAGVIALWEIAEVSKVVHSTLGLDTDDDVCPQACEALKG